MKILGVIYFTSLIFGACSSIPEKTFTGECLENKWDSGVFWRVKKTGERQLVKEKYSNGKYGEIKVISDLYGGWKKVNCPPQEKKLMP